MTTPLPLEGLAADWERANQKLLDRLAKLREPFPAETVGKLPATPKRPIELDYVGHAAVTDRLLTVDPEWSWEPVAYDSRGLPAYDEMGGLWIRLTICGVTRLGYGDGPDPKQRIGDAIRNAGMRFGIALYLWGKDELESLIGNEKVAKSRARKPPKSSTPTSGKPSRAASRAQDPATDDGEAAFSARDRNKVISHLAHLAMPITEKAAIDSEVSRLLGKAMTLVKLSAYEGATLMWKLGLGPDPEAEPAQLQLTPETPGQREARVAGELAAMSGQSEEPF